MHNKQNPDDPVGERKRALMALTIQLLLVKEFYEAFENYEIRSLTLVPNMLDKKALAAAQADLKHSRKSGACIVSSSASSKSKSSKNSLDNDRHNGAGQVASKKHVSHGYNGVKGPKCLPSTVSAYYERTLNQFFMLVAEDGKDYVAKANEYIDTVGFEVAKKALVATKFDMLNVAFHFMPLIKDVINREWYRVQSKDNQEIESFDNGHADLKVRFQPALSIWQHAYSKEMTSTVHTTTRPYVEKPTLDESRLKKFADLKHSLHHTFHEGLKVLLYIRKYEKAESASSKKTTVPLYWNHVAKAEKMSDLPKPYFNWIESICLAAAYIICNMLDNIPRLKMVALIWSLLPISFITVSLKFVNPAPLVDKVLRMSLWRPSKGTSSLIQIIACHICAADKTKTLIKKYKAVVPPSNAEIIEKLVETDKSLFGLEPHDSLTMKLKLQGIHYASSDDLKYLVACIRDREKTDFVEFLSDQRFIDMVSHFADFVHAFLDDVAKYGDISTIFGAMVKAATATLDALKKETKNVEDKNANKFPGFSNEAINTIQKAWMKFGETSFPFTRELARGAVKGDNGVVISTVNWIYTDIIPLLFQTEPTKEARFKRVHNSFTSGQIGLDRALAKLTHDEQTRVFMEVEHVLKLSKNGVDPRMWPYMPVLSERLVDAYRKECIHSARA